MGANAFSVRPILNNALPYEMLSHHDKAQTVTTVIKVTVTSHSMIPQESAEQKPLLGSCFLLFLLLLPMAAPPAGTAQSCFLSLSTTERLSLTRQLFSGEYILET